MGYALCRRPPTFAFEDWKFSALLQADLCMFWYTNLSSSHLWPFVYDIREHNKGHFEVKAWISFDFWWILLSMGVVWHALCIYFGVLGDPGTILGRSRDDPGTILGHWRAQGRTL